MADEYIRLDTTIIAIDNLINEAATGTMARTLFKAKDTIYSQQRYFIDVQPARRGKWLKNHEWCYHKGYTSSGYEPPYWCSECNNSAKNKSDFCPNCGADMRNKED